MKRNFSLSKIDRAFEQTLKRAYNLSLEYPWYSGWQYDRPIQSDSFLKQTVQELDAAPALISLLKVHHASIYVCGNFNQTHYATSLLSLFGRIDSTNGLCDPQRAEIFIARKSYSEEKEGYVRTANPAFIIAHELAHVIDSRLGKITDLYHEDPLVPTSKLDSYAAECLAHDEKQSELKKEFKIRARLLAGDSPIRNNASEILCDLIAHKVTNDNSQTYSDLANRYSHLADLSEVMLLAAQSQEAIKAYREMADQKMPLRQIAAQLKAGNISP